MGSSFSHLFSNLFFNLFCIFRKSQLAQNFTLKVTTFFSFALKICFLSALGFSATAAGKIKPNSSKTNATLAASSEELSPEAMAQTELKKDLVLEKRNSPTEVEVTGLVQLQAPKPQVDIRDWKLVGKIAALNFQERYSSTATDSKSSLYTMMENANSITAPMIEIGFIRSLSPRLDWGLSSHLAYHNRPVQVQYKSGFLDTSARLSSTLVDLSGNLQANYSRFIKPAVSIGYGQFLRNQSGTSSTFNKVSSSSFVFAQFDYGLELISNTDLVLSYRNQQDLTETANWQTNSDLYSLGVKTIW